MDEASVLYFDSVIKPEPRIPERFERKYGRGWEGIQKIAEVVRNKKIRLFFRLMLPEKFKNEMVLYSLDLLKEVLEGEFISDREKDEGLWS